MAVRAAPFALLRNTRKTERGAGQFLTDLEVRAAPFALLRNTLSRPIVSATCEQLPIGLSRAWRRLAKASSSSVGPAPAGAPLLRNTRKTERGAKQFRTPMAVRAAPFALLRNTRKTERGAKQFRTPMAVRAAPFALGI
jgi:hypothetical protein